jgi:trehalose/maltose hydrolase-like predicted phosphorylase
MEPYAYIDNDTFTNVSAAKALRIATEAAKLVGADADPRWAEVAAKLYVPFSDAEQRHLALDPGVRLQDPGDSDLTFLAFPSLDLQMDRTVRRNDYRNDVAPLQNKPAEALTSMGLAPLTIAAAALGDSADVAHWLADNIGSDMMKPPFNVRTETPGNNTGYFLTGSAGYVQSLVYGLTGLRVESSGLVQAYQPVLPSKWKSLTLTNVTFRGKHYDITVDRDASGKPRLQRHPR